MQCSAQDSEIKNSVTMATHESMTYTPAVKQYLPIFTAKPDSWETVWMQLQMSIRYGRSDNKFRDHLVIATSGASCTKQSLTTKATDKSDLVTAKVRSPSHGNHQSHQRIRKSKCYKCRQRGHHANVCPAEKPNINL